MSHVMLNILYMAVGILLCILADFAFRRWLYKKDLEAVMGKLGFSTTAVEPVPGMRHVMYAGKHANLTEAGIKLFHEYHERAYPGRGEVLLYL